MGVVLNLYFESLLRTDISGIRLLAVVSAKDYMTFQSILLLFMVILRYLESFQIGMPCIFRCM